MRSGNGGVILQREGLSDKLTLSRHLRKVRKEPCGELERSILGKERARAKGGRAEHASKI